MARGASTSARRDGAWLMKKIEAVIRPFTVDDVTDALIALGVGGLTVTEVHASGNGSDWTEHHLDAEYMTDLVPKAVVEVVVADDGHQWCNVWSRFPATGFGAYGAWMMLIS